MKWAEKRKIKEPYRQPFGDAITKKYGRPMGWVVFMGAVEKIFFPATLLVMGILRMWEPLLVTVAAESGISIGVLLFISRSPEHNRFMNSRSRGLEYFAKGLLLTPIRYMSILYDLVTVSVFTGQVWFSKETRWRK